MKAAPPMPPKRLSYGQLRWRKMLERCDPVRITFGYTRKPSSRVSFDTRWQCTTCGGFWLGVWCYPCPHCREKSGGLEKDKEWWADEWAVG